MLVCCVPFLFPQLVGLAKCLDVRGAICYLNFCCSYHSFMSTASALAELQLQKKLESVVSKHKRTVTFTGLAFVPSVVLTCCAGASSDLPLGML